MMNISQKPLYSFLVVLFLSSTLHAQISWVGGTTGNWNTAANWSGGAVPTATDNVLISSSVTITFDINPTIQHLEIDGTGIAVIFTAGAGNTLTIDGIGATTTDGLELDEGTLTIDSGFSLELENNFLHALDVNSNGILINDGSIYIKDYEGTLDGGQDGLRLDGGALTNNGMLTIDDLAIPGGNSAASYAMIVSAASFTNSAGATLRIVSPAMNTGNLGRDGLYVVTSSTVVNDGIIHIGNGDPARIGRYGIYNIASSFTNNNQIIIDGTLNYALRNDNAGAVFTNNGTIDIDHADDGIDNASDADNFINNATILIGNGIFTDIDDQGIRNFGIFNNYGTITIDGTNDQGLLNQGEFSNFTNHNTGIINLLHVDNNALQNGNGATPGLFTNDGGTINIGHGGRITGSVGLFNDDAATFINQNEGFIQIDSVNNDAIRSDALGLNGIINTGLGTIINIGMTGAGSIGNGSTSDDAIICNGNLTNENGAVINAQNVTGAGIRANATSNITNQSGGIMNFDFIEQTCIINFSEQGNKFLNTGANSVINIGQIGTIGINSTGDLGIQNLGVFENADGATIHIDNILIGEAIEVGDGNDIDTLINSGTINIAQNGSSILEVAGLHLRDSCYYIAQTGGILNIGNVEDYGIYMHPQSVMENGGTINILDYEVLSGGSDNGIFMDEASMTNDGAINIDDPNTTGFLAAHALHLTNNSMIDVGVTGTITIVGSNMTTGKIGGNAIFLSQSVLDNAGVIQIGDGDKTKFGANGIQSFESSITNQSSGIIQINGIPTNANAILSSSNSLISNSGTISIFNTHRGINNSSAAISFSNNGSINIGDGITSNITSHGIINATTFTNTGSITINGTSGDGFRSGHPNALVTNSATGIFTIDNTLENGLTNAIGTNNPSTFTNDGMIKIGTNGSIAQMAFINDDGGIFTNQGNALIKVENAASFAFKNDAMNVAFLNKDCAHIDVDGDLENMGLFTNDAMISISNGAYAFSNSILNNGYFQDESNVLTILDITSGMVDGITNPGVVVSDTLIACTGNIISSALISETNPLSSTIFSTSPNWYFDNNLTMLAGTYDAASNQFTYNAGATLPLFGEIDTLYYSQTGVNSCSLVGWIVVTQGDAINCPDCPIMEVVSGDLAGMGSISAIETVNTNGSTTVPNGEVTEFKAGQTICLEAEFEVQLGAEFHAHIEACSNTLTSPSTNLKTPQKTSKKAKRKSKFRLFR